MKLTAKIDVRDQLFYGRYQWALRFRLSHCWLIRKLDPGHLSRKISQYKDFSRLLVTPEQEQHLHDFTHFLIDNPCDYQRIISYHYSYIYSSNWEFLEKITEKPYLDKFSLKEARVGYPKGSVALTNSRYKFRTYLRNHLYSREEGIALSKYLWSQNNLKLGPGLNRALHINFSHAVGNYNFFYCRSYFFIDHNNPDDLLFLNLLIPNIIGITKPIIEYAENV